MDIEWIKTTNDINEYDFILKLISDIIHIFKSRYNLNITENNFFITEAHSNIKFSFHLVITTFDTQFLFKTNDKKLSMSAWDLYSPLVELNDDYKNKIDGAIYSFDREFRAIYSTKHGQSRLFVPITINEIKNKNRLYNVHKTSDFISNYSDYLITHCYDNKPIQFINVPISVHPLLTPYNKYTVVTNKEDNTKSIHVKNNFLQQKPESIILERLLELAITIHPTAHCILYW